MSTSLCGKISITLPKCIRKERGRDFYSRCSTVEAFGLPKEDTTRNHRLSCIYNTVPEQFKLNNWLCEMQRILQKTISWTWESSLQYQLCSKAVSIKWGNSNVTWAVWCFWLTACKYVFIFKEFATDYSNLNIEQCRVVLVVRRSSEYKCRHGNVDAAWCNAMRKKTVKAIVISNYVPTGCKKSLIYNRFYCFCLIATSHYSKGRNIFVTCLRYSANRNALDSWPISTHLT